ncbi:MAG: hypothetical protein R3B09_05785 [Nannocystaceae bacterium]
MDAFSSRGLLFLISMGAVPLACSDGGSGSETDNNSDATSETAGTTTAGTMTDGTATDGTATDGTTTAGTTTDGTTTAGTTTAGTTTGESTTSMETTTGGDNSVCADYAKAGALCYPRVPYDEWFDNCAAFVEDYAKYSQACLSAGEAFLQCKTMTACGEEPDCDAEYMTTTITCSPPPGEVCTNWGAKNAECYMKPLDQASYIALFCQKAIWNGNFDHGPACGMAIEDHYACVAALDCADFNSQAGCEGTFDKVLSECPL